MDYGQDEEVVRVADLVCIAPFIQDENSLAQGNHPRREQFAVGECGVEANRRLLELAYDLR